MFYNIRKIIMYDMVGLLCFACWNSLWLLWYYEIEIVLSNFSKDLKFLFNINNTKTSILNYNLNLFEKLSIIKKIIFTKYEKIFILSPKNIYFYLPLISKSKFYAISVKDLKRDRPFNFLKKRFHKFKINDRTNKKIFESIENLIEEISNESLTNYPNLLNNDPPISNILNKNLHLFDNFIHIHYKHSLFKKNDLVGIINSNSNPEKISTLIIIILYDFWVIFIL